MPKTGTTLQRVELIPLAGVPMVAPGCDLVALLTGVLARAGLSPKDGDVLVVAQKIVSKAEGRLVDLATVLPSAKARYPTYGKAKLPVALSLGKLLATLAIETEFTWLSMI